MKGQVGSDEGTLNGSVLFARKEMTAEHVARMPTPKRTRWRRTVDDDDVEGDDIAHK